MANRKNKHLRYYQPRVAPYLPGQPWHRFIPRPPATREYAKPKGVPANKQLDRRAARIVLGRLEACEMAPRDGGVLSGKGISLAEWERVKEMVCKELFHESDEAPLPADIPDDGTQDGWGLVPPVAGNGARGARIIGGELAPAPVPVRIQGAGAATRDDLLEAAGKPKLGVDFRNTGTKCRRNDEEGTEEPGRAGRVIRTR